MGVSGIAVRAHLLMQSESLTRLTFFFVIPAKAGIHHPLGKFQRPVMDPRLRGGDEGRKVT